MQLELAASHETRRLWLEKRKLEIESQYSLQEDFEIEIPKRHDTQTPSELLLQSVETKELEQLDLDLQSVFPASKPKKAKQKKETKKKSQLPQKPNYPQQKAVDMKDQ